MVTQLAEKGANTYEWIDVIDPGKDEIHRIAHEYNLHESSINDCLQPDHLPKIEHIDNYTFILLRVHIPGDHGEADTAQELTDKIAIFVAKECIITIRRKDWFQLDQICNKSVKDKVCKNPFQLLNEIVRAGLATFEEPNMKLTHSIEYLEENIFLRQRKISLLKKLYFVKRKTDVVRRLLLLSKDIIDFVDNPQHGNTYTRDTRDMYVHLQSIFDSLSENTNQILNIYFSISAQKTNEIIRVLTLFSVFFMPLTFIVGIYGMNFDFMPELHWHLGYPAVMITMALVTGGIFWWFRKKGWL
jgi:magnesium transporter